MKSAARPQGKVLDLHLAPREPVNPQSDPICADNPRPLIAEGEYEAFCHKAKRYFHPRFKREVISLFFDVVVNESAQTSLERYIYPQRRIGRGSLYYREWTLANNGNAPRRNDRMPIRKFEGKLYRVRVSTVKKACDQRDWPQSLQYSKIDAVLELLQTNEKLD